MTLKALIQAWQHAMNKMGANLTEDGDAGPKTLAQAESFELVSVELKRKPKSVAPAPVGDGPTWDGEARQHLGQHETNSRFAAMLTVVWSWLGLPGYRGLSGSSKAWCGVFVAFALGTAGLAYQKNGAGARNWAKYGVEIDYKRVGIPRGAIIHINHAHNCSSGSGNHVGFSNGDCTADDVKTGTFNMLGGNQSNKVSVVAFSIREICHVRWPTLTSDGKHVPLPELPIRKSSGCKGKAGSAGSTR